MSVEGSPELSHQYVRKWSPDTIQPIRKDPICHIRSYAGYSLAGHGPENMRKVNQDSLVMYVFLIVNVINSGLTA